MKQKDREHNEKIDLETENSTVSTTECTGLMPALPQEESQAESYRKLYSVLPPERSDPYHDIPED